MSNAKIARSLSGTAFRGVTTLSAVNVVAKLGGFATLFVTGALLSKNDFALFAITIACGEIFGFLQTGGLNRLMVQRAKSFDSLYAPVLGLAFAINSVWLVLLLVLAPVVATAFDAEEVKLLLVLYALSIPASTVALLIRANLLTKLRFDELSVLNMYTALIRNGGIMLLAVVGFGAMSFVLPIIAIAVFESVYLSRKRPGSWRPALPGRRLLKALIRPLFWIMLSTVALSLITNGDYLVIGAIESKETIGIYFFGFQLTVAVLTMFTRSLRNVFTPSFVALRNDRDRQERAFLRSLETGSLLLFFVIFGVATVADPAVSWLWSGKWDAAVPVIQIIAIASLARVVAPLIQSLLEARGEWRTIAMLSWIEGLGLMASAAIGAYLGGLLEIAMAVGVYMTVVGVFYILIISRYTALSVASLGRSVLGPYLMAGSALAMTWALTDVVTPPADLFLQTLVKGTLYVACFGLLIAVFRRQLVRTALDLLKSMRRTNDLQTTS
ncbi:MAG: oligosaccharide flippase family protein [Alphaproteobacteria bacterium]|nr:oligosaccharide flippase family protein [Alphaproteobacteria bacterium]